MKPRVHERPGFATKILQALIWIRFRRCTPWDDPAILLQYDGQYAQGNQL